MNAPKVGALFAGYGGLELAVRDVFPDAHPAWVAEFEDAPSRILAQRFPDAPNLGDVTTVDWAAVEPVDVITGGSPCQDLSHAGKRAGMRAGTRSGLWASMCDAIEIIRPRLVIWENVRGALSACASSETDRDLGPCPRCLDPDSGAGHAPNLRALGRVLGDLAELGFDASWTTVRASDVGAPHQRERVFVLAWDASADADPGWLDGRPTADARGAGIARLTLLRTPTAQLAVNGGSQHPEKRKAGGHGPTLADEVEYLLPTPTTTQRGGDANASTRAEAGPNLHNSVALLPTPLVENNENRQSDGYGPNLGTALRMLPTPAVNDMGASYDLETWEAWTARMKAAHGNGNGHGNSLHIEALRMIPTPSVADVEGGRKHRSGTRSGELLLNGLAHAQAFGQYAPAIARWGAVLDRPAPAPTEPTGKGGAHRLSPRFVEWLMGLPDGWVTDTDTTRNEQLKALGNGVVPQQAAAAIRHLLGIREMALTQEMAA